MKNNWVGGELDSPRSRDWLRSIWERMGAPWEFGGNGTVAEWTFIGRPTGRGRQLGPNLVRQTELQWPSRMLKKS
jgi:hypothetical protein